ncbi:MULTISPECIES: hypothetical protein [Calditerrivibrio]|uniref:hypothetical protein n=1 Tax=Calditerrivibrio TaxID=545865 RepID=UPI003C73F41D
MKDISLSFESKVFLLMLLVLMMGLTMINLIFIMTINGQIEDNLRQEIRNYQILLKHNIPFDYPEYLKISKNEMDGKKYTLFEVDKPNFFYVKNSYFQERIKDKILLMVYWDFIILMVISLLYYFTVHRMILKEKRVRSSFEAILLIFSHKLRNYLSTQKINLELLKGLNNSAVSRIEESYNRLNTDISAMENYVRNINIASEKIEEINLNNLLKDILIFNKKLKIKVKTSDLMVKGNRYDLEFLLFILMDNINKYAKSFVYIRSGIYKRRNYLLFLNDITDKQSGGLGVGLSLGEILCRKSGFRMRWKKNRYFIVLITF